MLPFALKYHEAIKAGTITLSFRDWDTLTVQINKLYRSYNLGLVKIIDVNFIKLAEITVDDIKKCGCRSIHQFKGEYEASAKRKVDFKAESAVMVEFEYVGEDIEDSKKLKGSVTPIELFEIKEKILNLEESCRPPWIIKTLENLSARGSLFSRDLESLLKLPAVTVKQNMRKLKEMHLIYSNDKKGYSLTPLSLKLFKIFDLK